MNTRHVSLFETHWIRPKEGYWVMLHDATMNYEDTPKKHIFRFLKLWPRPKNYENSQLPKHSNQYYAAITRSFQNFSGTSSNCSRFPNYLPRCPQGNMSKARDPLQP